MSGVRRAWWARMVGAHGGRACWARILRRERRICIVLEMRHLLGTMVEKEERLLLE